MKIIFFTAIILLSACSSISVKEDLKKQINFDNEMSFNEFRQKLEDYAKISDYPNIDD